MIMTQMEKYIFLLVFTPSVGVSFMKWKKC